MTFCYKSDEDEFYKFIRTITSYICFTYTPTQLLQMKDITAQEKPSN